MNKTWFIKEAYLHEDKSGMIVVRSSGHESQRINNVQVAIDHQNNCVIVYENLFYRTSVHSVANTYWYIGNPFVSQGTYKIDPKREPWSSNLRPDEVEPQYVETRYYSYTEGFWFWKRTVDKTYQLVRPGLVRLRTTPTRHTAQGNRWLIESQTGEVASNV